MIWTIIYQPLLATINNYQPLLPLLTIMNQPLLKQLVTNMKPLWTIINDDHPSFFCALPLFGASGNGSIMRLAPVPIAYSSQPREVGLG